MTFTKRYEEYEPMAYNSQLRPISQPEFGRNIQRMIEKAIAEPNRDTRNKMAMAIIEIMGQLNPQLRDVADFKHKLWDNLFIISDFKLDVDCPYPIPDAAILETKPEKVNYPARNIKYRHYGKTIENLIAKARLMVSNAKLIISQNRERLIKIKTANARIEYMYRNHLWSHLPFVGKFMEKKIWKEELSNQKHNSPFFTDKELDNIYHNAVMGVRK
jgi:hypothetical protein